MNKNNSLKTQTDFFIVSNSGWYLLETKTPHYVLDIILNDEFEIDNINDFELKIFGLI